MQIRNKNKAFVFYVKRPCYKIHGRLLMECKDFAIMVFKKEKFCYNAIRYNRINSDYLKYIIYYA